MIGSHKMGWIWLDRCLVLRGGFLGGLAGVVAVMLLAGSAQASPIFDSSLGSYGYTALLTRQNDTSNVAAVLEFSQNVTVSQIGIYSSVDQAQDIKFLVFDSLLNGGSGQLLLSDEKSFVQDSNQTWIYSDPINFTFLAGQTYDVGILGDGLSLTGEVGSGNYSQNGITEISENANITDFNNPYTGLYASTSPFVQLLAASTPVPEPSSIALFLAGLTAIGGAFYFGRRKMARANV